MEEQSYAFTSGPGFSLHSDIVAPYIEHHGTKEQKEKWLPGMASGDVITAIAMSEPAAGSDLQGIKTTAEKDGDEWVINGSKTFITNGQLTDMTIVVAKTDPDAGARGISLFIVESDRDGFSRGRNLEKVGMKAQDTSELFFDNVRVPAENLLGHEGAGFFYLMQELPRERRSVAVIAASAAHAALKETVKYVNEREAFGRSISKFQNTRFEIAEMLTKYEACQRLVDRCIVEQCNNTLTVPQAAAVKLHATELQWEITDRCVQLFGGYGYMWEYPIARALADARVQRIYAGTSEIMKELVSRAVLDEGSPASAKAAAE
jgi:acyl-CoA dehydrogenase